MHLVMEQQLLTRLELWRGRQPGIPSRSEAIRRVLGQFLGEWEKEVGLAEGELVKPVAETTRFRHSDLLRYQRLPSDTFNGETIQEVVLKRLAASGPEGSRTAPITVYLQNKYNVKLHERAVSCALLRLKKKGAVKKVNDIWFVV